MTFSLKRHSNFGRMTLSSWIDDLHIFVAYNFISLQNCHDRLPQVKNARPPVFSYSIEFKGIAVLICQCRYLVCRVPSKPTIFALDLKWFVHRVEISVR
jgi:hypothetical protein